MRALTISAVVVALCVWSMSLFILPLDVHQSNQRIAHLEAEVHALQLQGQPSGDRVVVDP